VTKMNLCES